MEKTHWKKNNDSAFISGEDLNSSLKGLKPEMVVQIASFTDSETFDQKKQNKIIITALNLVDLAGKKIYKPAILNKTNAKFLIKEFQSEYIEDWIGKPFTMYCQKDSRHGYVVRFKTYILSTLIIDSDNFIKCKKGLANGVTMDQIKKKYLVSKEVEEALLHV